MRPSYEEILAGVRRGLSEFVSPEVEDQYARTELGYASSLLQAISRELDIFPDTLHRENAALRRFLRRAGSRLSAADIADVGLRSDLASLGPRLVTRDLRVSALREQNAWLLSLLIRLQAACENASTPTVAVRRVYSESLAFLRTRAGLD